MPVAFLAGGRNARFVPVAGVPFRLGSAPHADLVEESAGVAGEHAELRYVKGEYVLTVGDGCVLEVNGRPAPVMALRDGDEVQLAAAGRRWTFRNRMEGTFRTPETSLAAAWMATPAFRETAHGPERFGPGPGVAGRDPDRCRRVEDPSGGGALVVKRLGRVRDAAEADGYLRVLAAVGGAPHPALAALVDGGLAPLTEGARRWMAARWVDGVPAPISIEDRDIEPGHALRVLRTIAAGLAHLHGRGVVHRDVSPGNVILTPDGGAVLIDFGQAVLASQGAPPSRGVVGTPGYTAPEEVVEGGARIGPAVDSYGLAAVGYALLTGRPPAAGEDVLELLAGAGRPPPRPRELGVALPRFLESVLLQALAPDPQARPDAAALVDALEFAGTQLGLGGFVP